MNIIYIKTKIIYQTYNLLLDSINNFILNILLNYKLKENITEKMIKKINDFLSSKLHACVL
jgi:hypothetical protein